jgi:hypothetical protein
LQIWASFNAALFLRLELHAISANSTRLLHSLRALGLDRTPDYYAVPVALQLRKPDNFVPPNRTNRYLVRCRALEVSRARASVPAILQVAHRMAEFVSRSLRSSRSSRYSLCAVSRTLSFERISYFYVKDNQELELVGMNKLDDRPPKGAIILPEWARKDPRNLASTSGVWTAISTAYFKDEDA